MLTMSSEEWSAVIIFMLLGSNHTAITATECHHLVLCVLDFNKKTQTNTKQSALN